MTYTAADIVILDQADVLERFFWAKANELAYQYKRPLEWIERGLQACERVNMPHDYFIDRYLKKLDIPKHDGVSSAMQDILDEVRPSGRHTKD